MDVGRLLGNVLGSSIPLAVGWGLAAYIRKRRNSPRLPRTPLVIGGILSVLMLLSALGQQLVRQQQLETVRVSRAEQPSGGLTEADLDAIH